jgi:hypothetical protein
MRRTINIAVFAMLVLTSHSLEAAEKTPMDSATVERFAGLALECVHQEYPNKIGHVRSGTCSRPMRMWLRHAS